MYDGDQADPSERHRESGPSQRPGDGAMPERRHERDQDWHGTDQQSGVTDARPGDAGVLQQDRTAVADRA
jgi:hypothetical protein